MKLGVGLFFFLLSASLFAQEKEAILQQRVEYFLEKLENDQIDMTAIAEQLAFYYDHPLYLNDCSKEDLLELGLLNEVQVNALILHRKLFGQFLSLYELQVVPYWNKEDIDRVLPFITLDEKWKHVQLKKDQILKYGKWESLVRWQRGIEQKEGYRKSADDFGALSSYYQGDPNKIYTRFKFSYLNNLSIGFLMEKDPGEKWNTKQAPFDFNSAHFFFKGGKYVKALAVGDYHIQIGQGLSCWTGYGLGKSLDGLTIKKSAQFLSPNNSADEHRFFRGVAAQFGYQKWTLGLFSSAKQVDGEVKIDTTDLQTDFYAAVYSSGYHRTKNELSRKNQFWEGVFGANLQWNHSKGHVGLAPIYQVYDHAISGGTLPYQKNDFKGRALFNLSLDYTYNWKNCLLFGEAAYASTQKMALLQGLLIAMGKDATLSLVYRNYQNGYYSFYNQGLREGFETSNESGWLTNFSLQIAPKWRWNSSIDYFRFPALKYQVNAPSYGVEILQQVNYTWSKKVELYVRYRFQNKQLNSRQLETSIKELEDVVQQNIRVHFQYQISDAVQLRTRVEGMTSFRPSNQREFGSLIFQDVIFKSKKFPIDFTLRYAFFDTDSYDSRIYAFESNMPTVFGVPAYYGKGSRFYALVRYQLKRHIDLWLRYGVTQFEQVKTISSGAEQINGNRRSDIHVQIRIQI